MWPWKMFSFTLLIVGLVVVLYFGLKIGYAPYLESRITGLDSEIDQLTRQIPEEDQENFITFYSQLANLQSLLKKHVQPSGLFSVLEKHTSTRVYFTTLDVQVSDRRIGLEGVATSYDALSDQLAEFGKVPEIVKFSVSESQALDGRVRFRILLFLAPSVFGNISE